MTTPPTSPSHRAKSKVTRRTMIGAAGAITAAAVITPTVMATTNDSDGASIDTDETKAGTTSETFPKTRAKAATGEAPVEAAFPIGYVGVRWEGTSGASGGGIRLTDADGGQGAWQDFSAAGCSETNGGALLIATDKASGYELKAPDGSTEMRSLALDTQEGPGRKVAVPSDPTRVRGVAYLSRPAWGADEKLRFKPDGTENTPTAYYPFQTIAVHHTATVNDDPDPAATVRAIYQLHAITNDWGDIGYHFLIDEAGNIYEGRYSGDDGIPAHDKDGNLVTGFHAVGYNIGNLGIALLGTLTDQGPTDAARESLTRLIRVLTRFHGVDPKATVTYKNPVNGNVKEVPEITGHRDWFDTECPGQTMYDELDRLRDAAARG
ncbi:N-acetylmuramoyl-L-alanine amidase [Streptomyces spongiae]|uniref:Tat pathway signal protein n=1 Tax=Streptomyces spongiae TaxID=565072 RepID=A0A5N8XQX2_9ACTN|nr:N-acetylmuramoyl-L-alanine amidase [Streptomyces spongiae]MPY61823.1 Tat pathway signal protein [Streptomyces spongiae]